MPIPPQEIIYLDNNATTPVAPEVFDAMVPFLRDYWGNPSSAYRFGKQVSQNIEAARLQVATLIGADPQEIFFTSCGTESDNSAISSALATTGKRKVVTTAVEHSAIMKQCERLKKNGIEVVFMPVKSDGTLDFKEVEKAIDEDTAICSVMWANNETGVLFPVEEIAEFCKLKDVLFHCDAVQAVGKIPINVQKNKIDMLSIVGHKLHAPKGIGALYIRRKTRYMPTMIGGSQEKGKRGGTENVASIVAFGKACELAAKKMNEENTRVKTLRDKLENEILTKIPKVKLNGHKELRLPNTSNLSFEGIEAEAILILLDHQNICASSGSACTTGSLEPSHVLTAMGLSPELAKAAVRFSLSVYNTEAEIDKTLEVLPGIVEKLRAAPKGTVTKDASPTAIQV
jgi:cysteine desulfurase